MSAYGRRIIRAANAARLGGPVEPDHDNIGYETLYGAITNTSNDPGRGAARPPPAGAGPGRDAMV
jgi:hypothetical protein